MKRFVGIFAGISAVGVLLVTGCFGSGNDEPGDTDAPSPAPTSVDDGDPPAAGNELSADSSSDGSTPNVPPPNDPPPVAVSEEVRRLRELASRDPDVLAAALDYFESLDDQRELEIFLTHLQHQDAEVRRGAMYGVFTRFDPQNEQILNGVQAALQDEDAIVRRLALKTMALDAFPREAFLDAVPGMARHLDDQYEPDAATRSHVARMLRRYTTSCRPALPALIDAMKSDPDFNVRSASLTALYDIAQNADEALTTPTWLLENDPDPRMRRRAAIQLGRYKQAAAPAIDELIGGAIYTPCDDVRWEFIFPRPRYARRYYASCDREDWWYIAGEFGGGAWAIERAGGADDVVTLADYRLLIGKEVKLNGGASRLLEAGYVFGREIQYQSATPTVELDSSFVIRGAITF